MKTIELLVPVAVFVAVVSVSLLLAWFLTKDSKYFENEGVLFDGQVTVSFSKEFSKQMKTEWVNSNGLEYSACVVGTQTFELNKNRFDTIRFNLTLMNAVQSGKDNYVHLPPCQTMAVIHSHPQESCQTVLGISDIESAKSMFRNGADLYLIQCDENKVEVYSRDNLYEGIVVELET